ncbi:MAG: sulfite exporter TauE/SafE family protein [Flavobacteriaceae bacterium]
MTEGMIFFFVLLPFVSFLYASVGHGGASGYLALMALFSMAPDTMKQTALLLNIFVAGIAFLQYNSAGYFRWRLFVWFALGSIPAAYWGGTFQIEPTLYKKILGLLLLFAILRILWAPAAPTQIKKAPPWVSVLMGASIGFFSGLIGIGGGIILTPLLILLNWADVKQAAAVSAIFIWVNSAAALGGMFFSGVHLSANVIPMVSIAFLGGWAGSYYGARKWKKNRLEQFLAVVLIAASIKLCVF